MKSHRRVGSISNELIKKSKEAALAAVQIFNNPNMTFKSESFIVSMIISWTYLLHAYYRKNGIEYRYYDKKASRKVFHKTKNGADKHWELERCLNDANSPIDKDSTNNLKFLIGLRHEIEHQMTTKIDDLLSARFQACCLNYNNYIKSLFKDEGIEKHLSFSLQFSTINTDQKDLLEDHKELPKNILSYIQDFDESLTDSEYGNPKYAYRILFVQKTVNHKGQADKVIEFIQASSPQAEGLNKEYVLLKEKEKKKYSATNVVNQMKEKGFNKFGMHQHTKLWQKLDAKNPSKNYGATVVKTWYWYDTWIKEVEKDCLKNKGVLCV